jgi:hypothetical protein
MSKSVRFRIALGAAAALAFMGCSSKEAAAPEAPAAAAVPAAPGSISAEASMLDLMANPIGTSAEALWNAVGSVATTEGSKDLAPSTDAEWAALREKAQALVDAAKALTTEGRLVARPGQKLKDPPGPGDLTPEQAQAAIAKDHAVFLGFALALQGVGDGYIAAIDKKDVAAFTDVGGKLDEVCESCHKRFWYPESGAPPIQ